jgi:hypothetical protein
MTNSNYSISSFKKLSAIKLIDILSGLKRLKVLTQENLHREHCLRSELVYRGYLQYKEFGFNGAPETICIKDDENPQFLYSTTNTKLLIMVANGVIDPAVLAKSELGKRGLDSNGTYIGF